MVVSGGVQSLIEVEGVSKRYRQKTGPFSALTVDALDRVSLSVPRGTTLGIVGESGSGKSTLARAIVGLERPSDGAVRVAGAELFGRGADSRAARRRIQMVFQDPRSSLDPRAEVGRSILEPLGRGTRGREAMSRLARMLDLVGLRSEFADRLPHELSGGQQQRVCIARALIAEPDVLVLDEAVSALDVSVQAQVLNLLSELQSLLGLTYVFISHDIAVVRLMSDDVAVMQLGRVIEQLPADSLDQRMVHPYSIALRSAVPIPDPPRERSRVRIVLHGDQPSPTSPPTGCRFRTRCPIAYDLCAEVEPALRQIDAGHAVACHEAERVREFGVDALTDTARGAGRC